MKIKLLVIVLVLSTAIKSYAQFSGSFAPANWTYSSTTAGGDGSINTTGVPSSIILSGSDNSSIESSGNYEQYTITVPSAGTISFSYSHVNPDVDKAYYIINGTQTLITNVGSGTKSGIAVSNSNVFGFRVVNDDNCCGRGVLTISDFVFTPSSPTITVQPTNKNICLGSNTTFSITASNTTSYQWQENTGSGFTDVANGAVYSGAATATLTITGVTAAMNGYLYQCIATGSISPPATSSTATLTVNPITVSVSSQTNVACNSGSNGAATILASGGTGTKTYQWAPSGGTAATASGLLVGNYTCTVTDANSCTKTQTVTITQPSALSSSASQTNVACNGGTTGSATVTPTGGTASYAYAWAPSGGTAATANSLTAGTYTCTVTDANTCTKTQTVTLTQPSALATSVSSQTNVACNGGATGAATITPTGGTTSYVYSWAPSGGNAATANSLTAGTYTCTVTDANTCTKTQTVTITQPSALSTSASQTNVTCNGGATGSATITVTGGTGTKTYAWAPSGGTAVTASSLSAGNYTCTVTDANSCTKTQTVTITQPSALSSSASQTNVSCNSGSNGTATILASGGTGTKTYQWAPSGGNGATANGLASGTYTCTVTDANSCTKTQTVTITQPSALSTSASQTNVACHGGATGSATITPDGGTSPYAYAWAPSGGAAATANSLTVGTYTCTVTDANSCSKTQTVTITEPSMLTSSIASQTNISCNGGTNGGATVLAAGGTSPYNYSWTPGGGTAASASGLTAGSYTCSVMDANTCMATSLFTITEPSAITTTASQTNIACNGGATGSATVAVTGGTGTKTYVWAPGGATTATASGLTAGSYTCTVSDANFCSAMQTVIITEPSILTSSVSSQTNVSCNGNSNGEATVLAAGGSSPYNYSWAPGGGTMATASGLSAGTYTCTITDANTCSQTQTVTITQPSILTSSVSSQTNVSCNGNSNGEATVLAAGGTSPYNYSWAPSGGTMATASGLTAGTYTCIVTDANSCSAMQTVTITEPVAINVSTTSNGATITVGETGATYQWIDCENNNSAIAGETNQSFTAKTNGKYAVIVTLGNCSKTSDCVDIISTDIQELNNNNLQLIIYPNPSAGILNVKSPVYGNYSIVNNLGQTLQSFELYANTSRTINIGDYGDGLFFIVGMKNNHLMRQKIVIMK